VVRLDVVDGFSVQLAAAGAGAADRATLGICN
jgi:hypothetical protein